MNEKEKQIEEMAKIMCDRCSNPFCCLDTEICAETLKDAELLYNEGYRKQSVGEWRKVYRSGVIVKDGWVARCCNNWANRKTQYCPYCGAKMGGGEE